MQYLTYEEYKDIGGTIDSAAFTRNIDRASGIIDNATFKRVADMAEIPAQVKALCRDLVEYLVANNTAGNVITGWSESSGGVSQSESYAVKTKDDQAKDIDNMICDYLSSVDDDNGTPLLYRGCV